MMDENRVMRLFRKHLAEENKKLVERAMSVDLQSNPRGLLNLAELADQRDPECVLANRQKEEAYSDNFERMLVDSVTRASNKVEATAAFTNLARHLAQRYGKDAMAKAQKLLGDE